MKHLLRFVVVLALQLPFADAEELRLNQIQVIGTHNSYHIAPHPSILQLISKSSEEQASALAYTHRPLAEQFSELGIRQIELDVYADPTGGKYAKPLGPKLVTDADLPEVPHHDPDGTLLKPGLKILHAPDVDYLTTVKTFVSALKQVKAWSKQHPQHIPIMIMIEAKQSQTMPGFTKPAPFDDDAFNAIDREILSVFEPARVISPDSVRSDMSTLRDAVLQKGWPSLKASRGKVIFALDNGGEFRDAYLKNHVSLRGRMLFVSVEETHPAAAFMKLNDAVGQFEHIQQMVRKGFLVRTRADSPTADARNNNTAKRDKALASGAQFVSTDYPEPNREFSEYCVRLPDNSVMRENPVNGVSSVAEAR